jgi:flavin reductase (DIM6/NTAB) family NADH-FMN oxidoreductase RutF
LWRPIPLVRIHPPEKAENWIRAQNTEKRPFGMTKGRDTMDQKAMFKISYGLYVVSAKENEKDNACISNTDTQVTSEPNRISVTLNKTNYTTGMIMRTKTFNASVLTTQVPLSVFHRFGFKSGKDIDKFEGFDSTLRSENGIYYLSEFANAFISGKVIEEIDVGTHITFLADVTDCEVLSDADSVTYDYYHKNIKKVPRKAAE